MTNLLGRDSRELITGKLRRAQVKAKKVIEDVRLFGESNEFSLVPEYRPGRLGVDFKCIMPDASETLINWSLDLGEIFYLLRSSLDNLVYHFACVHRNPPKEPRKLYFPIFEDCQGFLRNSRNLEPQIDPRIYERLERIQPYHRTKPDVDGRPELDPLVVLNWFSNQDKHRTPIPFLVPPKQINFSNSVRFDTISGANANIPPDIVVHADPLINGSVVLEHRSKHPLNLVSGKFEIHAEIVVMANGQQRGVVEVLGQLSWYVGLVIDELLKDPG